MPHPAAIASSLATLRAAGMGVPSQAGAGAQNSAGRYIAKGVPYFSHGRLTFTRTGTSPAFIYTLSTQTPLRLFGFAIGQDMAPAGRGGTTATSADTNLVVASQTIDSDTVTVYGVQLQLVSMGAQCDPLAAIQVLRDLSCKLTFNGSDRSLLLGNAEMIPGGAGPFAGGNGSLSAASGLATGTLTNGLAKFMNFLPIPYGFQWNPASKPDSSLVFVITPERLTSFAVSNANAPASVFVDIRVNLLSYQKGQSSPNI